ncbi:MAG: hypothetical protein SCALA702_19250 [Melioribacteraceae bacterium]|nr:MAG: hypothetical protein SCALA702_19250 [Melioribacteraceae bacterium]
MKIKGLLFVFLILLFGYVNSFASTDDVTEVITIAEARADADNDLVPDLLGQTVTISGLVMSPNYQTSNHSYYIQDATGGITTFFAGSTSPELELGTEVEVTGVIGQYNGLTQLQPENGDAFTIISTGNTPYAPAVMTIADFLANAEMYEGQLVAFQNVTLTGGTWPSSGSTTLQVSDATGEIDVRIDSDMDISGQPEPTWPVDIIGMAGQFDSQSPYDEGYQILPRYYASDFAPAGSVPVELTSFSASVSGSSVELSWTTATELNNKGFEIEKNFAGEWTTIAFVDGNGTTNEINSYNFIDKVDNYEGSIEYRLKQIDFDGTVSFSESISVEVTSIPSEFNLTQNYPNPFNPTTNITFAIPENGNVKLSVYNMLGEEIAVLINGYREAGNYEVTFNASALNSGIYLYKIEAGNFVNIKKMMLVK